MSKVSTLTVILLLTALSVALANSTSAQSMSKPSVPEFTAKYIDLSYDVPPTYAVDQYTGNTVVKQDGYHVDNRSIQFTIKNQPFIPAATDLSSNLTGLFFNFRVKGAYGTDWDYYPFAPDGQSTRTYGGPFVPLDERPPAPAFNQSNTEYTTVTIEIPQLYDVSKGAQLDVQVQAIAGHMWYQDRQYHFSGEYSDWSSTGTVTVGESQTSVNPITQPYPSTPTEIPLQPHTQAAAGLEFEWEQIVIVILCVVVTVLAVVLVLSRKKQAKIACA